MIRSGLEIAEQNEGLTQQQNNWIGEVRNWLQEQEAADNLDQPASAIRQIQQMDAPMIPEFSDSTVTEAEESTINSYLST